mmetsp:Transcript_2995/g.12385  ORF Transcript_2995/g.12385 Transcript_2995/m.12385 type:complete len:249 (+) Transcript_2995:2626-3372(+)
MLSCRRMSGVSLGLGPAAGGLPKSPATLDAKRISARVLAYLFTTSLGGALTSNKNRDFDMSGFSGSNAFPDAVSDVSARAFDASRLPPADLPDWPPSRYSSSSSASPAPGITVSCRKSSSVSYGSCSSSYRIAMHRVTMIARIAFVNPGTDRSVKISPRARRRERLSRTMKRKMHWIFFHPALGRGNTTVSWGTRSRMIISLFDLLAPRLFLSARRASRSISSSSSTSLLSFTPWYTVRTMTAGPGPS